MHFLPTALRAIAAAALALAVANLVHLWSILLRATLYGEQPFDLGRLVIRLVLLSLAPLLVAAAIRRTGRASYSLGSDRLVVQRGRALTEIPLDSIAEVRLSRLPFPQPALALRLRSGRMLRERIEVPDPAPVLEALSPRVPSAGPLHSHPLVAFASARAPLLGPRARRIAVKFILFPLLPGLVMFRAHQYIAFGGPFGEYRFYGAVAYLRTLAGYLAATVAVLVLYAAAWRILAETCAAIATALWPRRARVWRRMAEAICWVTYYLGVPALLALRFLA
jgi:hypothetical protein